LVFIMIKYDKSSIILLLIKVVVYFIADTGADFVELPLRVTRCRIGFSPIEKLRKKLKTFFSFLSPYVYL
jgi:hypothetical protein